MNATTPILDPEDVRVAEYRHMNDQPTRRAMEGDEYFLSEGWVSIERLIETGHHFRSVLLSPSRVNRFRPFMDQPALKNVPVYVAEADVIHRVAGFEMPRAVVMSIDRKPLVPVAELAAASHRLVVLEALNDNENVGAIARAARAFGVDGIVLSPTCTDPYYRRTVRVSMGEILHLPLARVVTAKWPSALDVLHTAGFETWAMTPAASATELWATAVPDKLAIMLGAEGPGLTEAAIGAATRQVRIPIRAAVDSLNVGHAAAITFAAVDRG
ncbi:MAG: tRNA G18 (ribose-2'-O)-methylase SpoU [Candidatus Aldehydirespiratoraceae bacterium]|jgi:tRNA G18 (ribose-2'-O)-methylase SpoU